MMGTTASPSVTGKAPPGMKSFWTSMTRRASVGWSMSIVVSMVFHRGGVRVALHAMTHLWRKSQKMVPRIYGEGCFAVGLMLLWMVPILMSGGLQALSVQKPVIQTSPSPNIAP